MEKKFDIEDRLVEFAAKVAMFCKQLPTDWTGLYYGKQLLRSGGSSALNFGEFQGSNTDRDRINKLSIALKELKESRINLRILQKLNYGNRSELEPLLDEGEQLIRILATIIKNKK